MQRVKMGKKKGEQTESKWRHSTEAVEKGKVAYVCKFLGSTPVSHSKGSELIKEAIKKLQFANDIKKSEEGLKASKLKKVELCISVQNLILTDMKLKTTLYSFPLQRISYCADDKSSKRLFGFIAREKESSQHHCYILECEKNAEELTLAVGQAFDLAYKKFKADQAGKKNVHQMQQQVDSTTKENELLKKRLEELERAQQQEAVASPPPVAAPAAAAAAAAAPPPSEDAGQPTFDPFSESPIVSFDPKPSTDDPFLPPGDPTTSETFSAGVGSNPFAAVPAQEKPTSNQVDLLNMFTAPENPAISSQSDDPFDPLAQINDTPSVQQNTQQQMPMFSSVDEAPSQQGDVPASLSRPKSVGLSGGLLPPPPTKQSIKEKNKNSNSPAAQQASGASVDPFAGLDPMVNSSLTSNHQQEVKDVQDGLQNNLVLF